MSESGMTLPPRIIKLHCRRRMALQPLSQVTLARCGCRGGGGPSTATERWEALCRNKVSEVCVSLCVLVSMDAEVKHWLEKREKTTISDCTTEHVPGVVAFSRRPVQL